MLQSPKEIELMLEPGTKLRIAYFIPEFPGQTHIFFWRERQVLTELGVEVDWVSTRHPPEAVICHSWALEAQENTSYLVPLGFKDSIRATIELLRAGPRAWLKCIAVVIKAKNLSPLQKLRLLAMVFIASKLAWLAREKGWIHIHVHSCANTANIAMFASILSGLSYSLTLHGPNLALYGPNQEQKWQYASFALVVSEKLFNHAKEKLTGYLPKQVVVVPMGVDLIKIKRNSPYTPWESNTPCRVFSCGRLHFVKGHDYLISAVEQLRQRGFDIRLQIAGEDHQGGSGYRRELERIIQDKSLSEYVELLGAVSEERIRQSLENAHLFALASLNEGIPVAVMEAMAMELPVVVTDVGGNSELVDNGVDGILVQPKDAEAMANGIAEVLQNRELALAFSKKSREKIAAKFHHRRSAETLLDCLKEFKREEQAVSS